MKRDEGRHTTYAIALTGIMTALGWVLVALAGVLPGGRLVLLSLASCITLVLERVLSYRAALAAFPALALLTMLWPGPHMALLIALWFGPLPLLILWLRRHLSPLWQTIALHAVMTGLASAAVAAVGIGRLVSDRLALSDTILWLIFLGGIQLFLVLYRYGFGLFERIFETEILPKLTRRR